MSRLQVAAIENVVPGNPVTLVGSQVIDNSAQVTAATVTVNSDANVAAQKIYSIRSTRINHDPNGFAAEVSFLTGDAAGSDGSIAFYTNDGTSSAVTALPERMRIKPTGEVEIGSGGAASTTARLSITQSTSTFALELRNNARAYALRLDATTNALILSDRTAGTDRLSISASGAVTLGSSLSGTTGTFSGGLTAASPNSPSDVSTSVATTAWIDAVFNGAGRSLKSAWAGYQRFPGNNGLIIQWGLAISPTPYNGAPISFPVAYPNECLQVIVSDAGAGMHNCGAGDMTVTGFKAYGGYFNGSTSTFQPTSFRWLAIGY